MVLAPHCDDETLGCGGLLAKYPHESVVLVVAHPTEVRKKEFIRAQEVLGYAEYQILDYTDGYIGADMHSLVGDLDAAISRWEPEELYLPYPSMHQDHIACYEAGVRAGRLSMTEGHHFTPSLYVYDVAAYDVNLYPTDLRWNVFEALVDDQIEKKVAALEAYDSQAMSGPHPANALRQQAATIGAARQVDYAEAYALVRKVRK